MFKNILLSFRENVQAKTTNPFLATYMFVWVLRNWHLVYSLFNFDETHNLEFKIGFIKEYYSKTTFIEGVFFNIGWTLLVLILTYLLLNISRIIVNLFEKQLKPWIYSWTDEKSTVLKPFYVLVRNERDDLQLRLDSERESKSKLESRIKSLEEILLVRDKQIIDSQKGLGIETDSSFESETYKYFKSEKLILPFREAAMLTLRKQSVSDDSIGIQRFQEFKLLRYEQSSGNTNTIYSLTPKGEALLDLIIKKEMLLSKFAKS